MSPLRENAKIIVEPTVEAATLEAANLVKTIICESVSRNGLCRVALAGGTTPRALYRVLSETGMTDEVPWGKVEIYFGDERDVPLDDIESNYNMVQRALLDHIPIHPLSVHPMRADMEDLHKAAAEYEQEIRTAFGSGPDEIPRFDLILLGVGADGHTASLFQGTEVLAEREKLVAACNVPVLGRWRMTFTYPLINAAKTVLMLVTGADKSHVVAGLFSENPSDAENLPAGGVALNDGTCFVVLDAPAGRGAGLRF